MLGVSTPKTIYIHISNDNSICMVKSIIIQKLFLGHLGNPVDYTCNFNFHPHFQQTTQNQLRDAVCMQLGNEIGSSWNLIQNLFTQVEILVSNLGETSNGETPRPPFWFPSKTDWTLGKFIISYNGLSQDLFNYSLILSINLKKTGF